MSPNPSAAFENEEDLTNHLLSKIGSDRKVAIVGGHFMLMCDEQRQALVPMIWQDAGNPQISHFSQKMAGDFPVKSFAFGAHLREHLLFSFPESDPKLALLVNDHIYQTPPWMPYTPELDGLKHRSLKKAFYRQRYPLPPSFRKILGCPQNAASFFVDNSNLDRTRNDILPKKTYFFSEQQLRNRFDKYTRDYLRLDPAFVEAPASEKSRRLLFVNPTRPHELCLTEEGSCGCSGEVIEFLMSLLRRGYNTIVFLIPDECRNAAMAGIEATIYYQAGPRRLQLEVFALFGFGGMGHRLNSEPHNLILEHVESMAT